MAVLRRPIDRAAGDADNPLRQDVRRTGHAHAGVLLRRALVVLRFVASS